MFISVDSDCPGFNTFICSNGIPAWYEFPIVGTGALGVILPGMERGKGMAGRIGFNNGLAFKIGFDAEDNSRETEWLRDAVEIVVFPGV